MWEKFKSQTQYYLKEKEKGRLQEDGNGEKNEVKEAESKWVERWQLLNFVNGKLKWKILSLISLGIDG